MTHEEHLARAAWLFDRMLDNVGSSYTGPGRPKLVRELGEQMDHELAMARAARLTETAVPDEDGE